MLGVCYYPEHWPESLWAEDAREMVELGLRYVRIGEFAWSRLESAPGVFHFEWLDRAIDTLAQAGLSVIMCTPTATPPKWLIDLYPDILPVDIKTGTVRGFGSRRHYDFSSENYRREAMRISQVVAKRYGTHPAICGWQTDNEIACHDTAHSGSQNAKIAFQRWCKQFYGTIDKLNQAWGNVFWSMEYQSFEQIELPILAVTETSPSHQLAYRRFSSDQVVKFHDEMVDVIRAHAPNQFVTHNFIPMHDTQTDNFALAKKLDFVSYDNYPLGRTDLFFGDAPVAQFKKYMRTGHPDFSSYAFDQSRGISNSSFWVMEQQPGPVNWARHNPRPEKGMVRLWSWQAFAHGAEAVCYFRWRQVPFAQEQMHAGIKRNDNSRAAAYAEIAQVRDELKLIADLAEQPVQAKVAIVMTTENQWVTEIERQGDSFNQHKVEFGWYSALRQLGLAVDFVSPEHDLSPYQLIVAPCMPIVSQSFVDRCKASSALLVFGPRSGAKTSELTLVPNLGPGLLQQLIGVKVLSTETIRPDCYEELKLATKSGNSYQSTQWREELELSANTRVIASYHDKTPAVARDGRTLYVATLSCNSFLVDLFADLANELQLPILRLDESLRSVQRGNLHFVFNYSAKVQQVVAPQHADFLIGGSTIQPYDLAVLRLR
ncbi:beta-galactosidase [Rheinheimera tangshanensis]|jgi:beta-galactosidase|uniref:Beta-galactosidase n=2 Tax=Pseudomonadota TaxID=1224 RepID=A0A5C8M1L1_9GAMM|nr:beta-galactosidase [Rheinheimera tangshanensis]TXK81280.1 beta-galactosidase [Rheinheimera tangshanensis]GGM59569.1 beta-galactosidase [Rheinheimera tangshanensis]